jgi:AcrR family transcriptional regulator
MLATEANERRAQRAAARQAQILAAAARVFGQKGFERATTREIAAAADVSEGTLYNYFDSKVDLLDGVARAFADELSARIAAIEADNLADMMAQLLADRLRSGRERRLLMLFLHEARLNPGNPCPAVRDALQRVIDATEKRFGELIAAGVMRPVEPDVAARAVSATIMGFAALYELGQYAPQEAAGGAHSAERWGRELTDIFLYGLQDCAASSYRTTEPP